MTAGVAESSSPASVVTALYLRTKTLHVEAERTWIIRDLLRGEASRDGYVLLLRNLLPAYQAMEHGLERHRGSAVLGAIADYRFDRAPAIESDLAALCGARWSHDIPLLAAGELYASRVTEAAKGNGAKLIAHAYTRYLGDLSGGQILQRLLARSLELRPAELSFYDFPCFADLDALKADYRKALDQAGALAADPDAVIEEGAIAFSLNIDLSCAVRCVATGGPAVAAAE
jgi:heme oxygenase (biliverdin-producing, ferredoxin)